MRLRELLEGTYFDEKHFVKQSENGRELDFDLNDDLIHFMHNDDHAYRRFVYPVIAKCVDSIDNKKKISSDLFEPAIKECYKLYVKKFPIRELPDSLDEETLHQVCDQLKEEFIEHHSDGKYKD
jgi:hypothetical protein